MKTRIFKNNFRLNAGLILVMGISMITVILSCKKDNSLDVTITGEPFTDPQYNTDQSVSDEAQSNTFCFDALGFMTGSLGSQTFLPPGKVADYSGFQYFRDNDQTEMGHNTDFVTIIASNMLNILNDDQITMYINSANEQISLINQYAYKRFPLCKAFRRLIDGDLPAGKTTLNEDSVKAYSARLYVLDAQISYGRAQLFGKVISSLTTDQKAQILALRNSNGVGNWPQNLPDKLKDKGLSHDVNIAVMTYASEMYTWYAGSVTADVYFCPERQGTYFGSFYLKDWPAMGNPNYTIDAQLTANAGQNFLNILTTDQKNLITGLVALQKSSLLGLVENRRAISTELRKFLAGETADYATIQSLSEQYGRNDGEIIYLYATRFSQVYKSMSASQKSQLTSLANQLGYVNPTGAFLYSSPIAMPTIENTDYLFK